MAVTEFDGITDPIYVKAALVLQGASGLPRDEVVNTLHFVAQDGSAWQTQVQTAVQALLNGVGQYLSDDVSRTDAVVKVYDLSYAPPNPPVVELPVTVPAKAVGTYDMPQEVALCLSYQAPVIPSYTQKRRRGRLYIGPLVTGAGDGSRPGSPLITAVASAGAALGEEAYYTSAVLAWAVFSPTLAGGWMEPGGSGPPNLAAAVAPVTNGWVDNSWDTQRRRGLAPTSRTIFVPSAP